MGASNSRLARQQQNNGTSSSFEDDARTDLRSQAARAGAQERSRRHYIMNRGRSDVSPIARTTTTTTTTTTDSNNVITKKTSTIRNHVNVKKNSVYFLKNVSQSNCYYSIEFTYDATKKCACTVFLWDLKKKKFESVCFRKPCIAGFSENVSVSLGTRDPKNFHIQNSPHSMGSSGSSESYAVIIRLECIGDLTETQDVANRVLFVDSLLDEEQEKKHYFDHEKEATSDIEIDSSIQAQTTYCLSLNNNFSTSPLSDSSSSSSSSKVQVVKQIINVNGSSYELQEIYGIENNNSVSNEKNDSESQILEQQQSQQQRDVDEDEIMCVVCLSEPKDTTVLPCRHMCMCSECARALRHQSNRCPICRNPVESLLEILITPS